MADPPADHGATFLTERQTQVLSRRHAGLTQREIAEELGTSVPNISAVERAARDNVERARRTVELAGRLEAAVRFVQPQGTHLRELVEAVYAAGDEAGVKLPVADPELAAYLRVALRDRFEGRRLVEPVEVGVTPDGDVVTADPP